MPKTQMNFYVVLFIEEAANGLGFEYLAIFCNEELPRYGCFQLRSRAREFHSRHNTILIRIKPGQLGCVCDRERQCRVQVVPLCLNREAA